jgi:predicted GIY-YIG superfamily endonuclease
MSCTLYILQSQVKETYYTGISDDANTRSIYHNAENKGYTKRYKESLPNLIFTDYLDFHFYRDGDFQ